MKLAEFNDLLETRELTRAARAEALQAGNAGLVELLDKQLADYQERIDAALAEAARVFSNDPDEEAL